MDDILNETLTNYYKALSVVGYKKDQVVYKILVMMYMQDVLNEDCITSEDKELIWNLLYKFMGSTCEIPLDCKCCASK